MTDREILKYFCTPMKQPFGLQTILLGLLIISAVELSAQSSERLRIMTYNVLSYRTTNGQCTGSNNNPTNKDGYIRTIVQYVDPDIIVMNEIGAQPVNSDRLLTNSLNVTGINKWNQADYSNNSFSNLVNMLFYDSTKVGLHSQTYVERDLQNSSLVRVIDLYRMYYKDPLLYLGGDTVYFTVVALHLKAGNTSADEAARGRATAALIDYLKTQVDDEAVFICGDYNTYSANEPAIQNLVNAGPLSERIYDPINALVTWNNSPLYANAHTQSTRNSGNTNGGCFSGGGMDDRFDMILVSDAVVNDASSSVRYVNGSYEVVGNDGNHFNKSIKDAPTNTSAPALVIDALHDNSDHLPVTLEFDVDRLVLSTHEFPTIQQLRVQNPVVESLNLRLKANGDSHIKVLLMDLLGRTVWQQTLEIGSDGWFRLEQAAFTAPAGLYLLQIEGNQWQHTEKLIKR